LVQTFTMTHEHLDLVSVFLIIFAYLLGSVSSAIILTRLLGLQDPRSVGSGNPGATNVLRYGGKKVAALTLVGDIVKGVIPVLIAHMLSVSSLVMATVMLAAFLGHLFPVYFNFKGGKGVATALGVLTTYDPLLGLVLIGAWLLTALITRISSLSALVATAAAPVFMVWKGDPQPIVLATVLIVALIFWRHKANIQRILKGEESRIKFKS